VPTPFDVIIVGLGAMGSAAAYHLARRGQKVLGLDRFGPPHALGSSHGETRIIREAYFEHPLYVPIVQRAYELWAELEGQAGRQFLRQTGGLMVGPPDGVVVGGARRSAEKHRLIHEVFSAHEVRRRFPALRPADGMLAVWEPRAGILFPELCIEAHLGRARKHGAQLNTEEPALRWEPAGAGVRIITSKGAYQAGQLLLTAGSWLGALLPDLKLPLTVERQILFWFEPKNNPVQFDPDRCPVYLWEYEPRKYFYGFPDLGSGVKVARHHQGEVTAPDSLNRAVSDDEVEVMREIVKRFLPDANGALRSAVVCMYTNTPDEHFLIDRHPEHPQVLIGSPCSGHGFKFSSAIGEILGDLLCAGRSRFDLGLFGYRFGSVTDLRT
jgi:sarcosine oxidase